MLVINSNLGFISHSLRDVASFPLKNADLSYHSPLSPNFEHIFLAIDRRNFACICLRRIANYSCQEFSLTIYPLARLHLLQTERETTDDNRAIRSNVILK